MPQKFKQVCYFSTETIMDLIEMTINGTTDGVISVVPVEVDVAGVSAIAVFYVLMILVGGWATWNHHRRKLPDTTTQSEELLLAGRRLGLFMAAASLSGIYNCWK